MFCKVAPIKPTVKRFRFDFVLFFRAIILKNVSSYIIQFIKLHWPKKLKFTSRDGVVHVWTQLRVWLSVLAQFCATPNFKRGGESCEEKKLRKWQWSGGGENEETKVFIFTRFFLIHFVCTFYIYILNNKIDLELSGWLAWLYCITKHLCQLIICSLDQFFRFFIII